MPPLHIAIGKELQRGNIEAVMIVAIREIIDIVPSNCIYPIVDRSLVGPLARTREVRFQGRRPSVKVAHHVSVVCPSFAEDGFKSRWKFFEGRYLSVAWQINQVHFVQLRVSNESAKYTLYNVGSI